MGPNTPPAVIPSPDPWESLGWQVRLDLRSLSVSPAPAPALLPDRPELGQIAVTPDERVFLVYEPDGCGVYRWERGVEELNLVSVLPDGTPTCPFLWVDISDDGRYVAFGAQLSGASRSGFSVFLRDVPAEETYLVSTITSGEILECPPASETEPYLGVTTRSFHLSGDGRTVVFESCAANLAGASPNPPLSNGPWDERNFSTYIVRLTPFTQLTHRRVAVGLTRE